MPIDPLTQDKAREDYVAQSDVWVRLLDAEGNRLLTRHELNDRDQADTRKTVSYTHLTLPTICSV
eukprot:4766258-Alexandrium_andersonii.AAC.1